MLIFKKIIIILHLLFTDYQEFENEIDQLEILTLENVNGVILIFNN